MHGYFIWLLKIFTLFIMVFIGIPLMIVLVSHFTEGEFEDVVGKDGRNVVAVVELTGIIDNSKDILEQLHKQVSNEKVKGIVLRIDSPGGAVGPSQDIYSAVKRLKDKKPIVVSMGSVAASGGLYAALGASKVYCQPGTITGSIGVILQVPNFHKVTERLGVDMITIKSGNLKDVGNSFREMTEEERKFLENTVHTAHGEFINAVSEGRGIEHERVLEFADGRVILGSQAKEYKLVDEFGDVYDAARAVFGILQKPLSDGEVPELYYPDDKFGKFRELLDAGTRAIGLISRPSMQLQYVMY